MFKGWGKKAGYKHTGLLTENRTQPLHYKVANYTLLILPNTSASLFYYFSLHMYKSPFLLSNYLIKLLDLTSWMMSPVVLYSVIPLCLLNISEINKHIYVNWNLKYIFNLKNTVSRNLFRTYFFTQSLRNINNVSREKLFCKFCICN